MIAKKGQPAPGRSESLGARFIQRETLRSDTSKPSMSSSPWMRGAPQVGFSATMRKITSRTSFDRLCLPTCFLAFEIQLQYSRKPARCQPTTVSGLTSTRDCFQAPQKRRANTQNLLSTAPIRSRGCLRFSTASCCRRARFSKSRLRCDCKQRVSRPNHNSM